MNKESNATARVCLRGRVFRGQMQGWISPAGKVRMAYGLIEMLEFSDEDWERLIKARKDPAYKWSCRVNGPARGVDIHKEDE